MKRNGTKTNKQTNKHVKGMNIMKRTKKTHSNQIIRSRQIRIDLEKKRKRGINQQKKKGWPAKLRWFGQKWDNAFFSPARSAKMPISRYRESLK